MCKHERRTRVLAQVVIYKGSLTQARQVAYCNECDRLVDLYETEPKVLYGSEIVEVFDAIYNLVAGVDEAMLAVNEAVDGAIKGLNQ